MINRLYIVLILFNFLYVVHSQDIDKNTPSSSFEEKLSSRIIDVIKLIKTEYPTYAKEIENGDNENRLVERFVNSLGFGIKYINSNNMVSVDKESVVDKSNKKEEPNVYRGITIASDKILYLRMESFSKQSYNKLYDDCIKISRLDNSPIGIIIDLRQCNGYDFKYLRQSLEIFCSDDLIGVAKIDKQSKRIYSVPVTVLISAETSGVAELFTHSILEANQGLAIGDFSSGKPFLNKEIKLQNSDSILVPQIPEFITNFSIKPIKPSITIAPHPQSTFEEIYEGLVNEKSDKCFCRAVEILIGLDAVKKLWDK